MANNAPPFAPRHLAAAILLSGSAWGLDLVPGRALSESPPHPQSRERLRALATDRPDKTESPYTVDPGHLQVEVELFRFTRDRQQTGTGPLTREQWAVGSSLVKWGLTPNLDLGLELEPYQQSRESAPVVDGAVPAEHRVTRREGFGPLNLRLKWNLWGNDAGRSALALLPSVQFPTGQDNLDSGLIEPALILPFALDLGRGWELGVQTGWGWAGDADDRRHRFQVLNSVTVGMELGLHWSGYVEFWALVDTTEPDAWQGTFDLGLNFLINDNLKLDLGLNVGLTDTAPDWEPFVGLSWRR